MCVQRLINPLSVAGIIASIWKASMSPWMIDVGLGFVSKPSVELTWVFVFDEKLR